MAKFKVEQVRDAGNHGTLGATGKVVRRAVVDESKVSGARDAFRASMRKHADESSDMVRVTKR